MLDCARRKMPVPALARWLLGLTIAATCGHQRRARPGRRGGGSVARSGAGRLVRAPHNGLSALPQVPAGVAPDTERDVDPLQERAVELFVGQLADRIASVRAIRAQLHIGQPPAQRLRDYLATGAATQWTRCVSKSGEASGLEARRPTVPRK
jgi:hypothetical protein